MILKKILFLIIAICITLWFSWPTLIPKPPVAPVTVYQPQSLKIDEVTALKSNMQSDSTRDKLPKLENIPDPKKAHYIVACEDKQYPQDFETKLQKNFDEVHQLLKGSQVADEQYASIVFSTNDDPLKTLESLNTFLAKRPSHTHGQFLVMNLCTNLKYHCSKQLVNNALKSDISNGMMWLYLAIFHLNNNDQKSAIEALYQATDSNKFNDHFGEEAQLFFNIFHNNSEMPEAFSLLAAFGVSASMSFPSLTPVFDLCGKSLSNPDLAELCVFLGKRMAQGANSVLSHKLGLAIQKIGLQAQGRDDEVRSSEHNIKKSKANYQNKASMQAQNLMMHDAQLALSSMNTLAENGEIAASEQLLKDAIAFSQSPDYHPCDVTNAPPKP